VPILIQALVDPNRKTDAALVALLDTAFIHYIDAPSLALVVPILRRGLKERLTDVKKRSTQIMGNMASLTDPKDLIPYLGVLMPGLKDVLIDPVPDARATAAKALGLMVERLGESSFPGLVAELISTLKSDTSSVDRSGASQGLSEVLSGLGIERLEGLLPEIELNLMSKMPYIREGFMTLLIYLPSTYRDRFEVYLERIVPCVLRGLSDDYEGVRSASLLAAQSVVHHYASTAIDLLLPELERGLTDANWRIRQSSLHLMGDLLFKIAGISKGSGDLDDQIESASADTAKKTLVDRLGQERYYGILASLYIGRSDAHGIVRQASLGVWKSIVSNTPRTLKDILQVMMKVLIVGMASPSVEKRGVSARTLGDIVRKMGENILSQIIPMLENGLMSDSSDSRQGVCIGISEILSAATKQQVADFGLLCIPSIRKALIDQEATVRESAAQAFDLLHQTIGSKAVDEILPSLLRELEADGDGKAFALEALKEIMSVRSNVVFPVLLPKLMMKPITAFNARALGLLIPVAGGALNKRIGIIFEALVEGVELKIESSEQCKETLDELVLSVNEDGLVVLMDLLTELSKVPKSRVTACSLVGKFFSENPYIEQPEYIADWIVRLVELMRVDVAMGVGIETVKAAWSALGSITGEIDKEDMGQYIVTCRKALAFVAVDSGDTLDGFNLPRGISPLVTIFVTGLMSGANDMRAQAALGLGDLVKLTDAEHLKPFVTLIVGPLIRVMGDKVPEVVRVAILETMSEVLARGAAMVKAFLPQLQRTFIKCLADGESGRVRDLGGVCLGRLVGLQARLDPLSVELVTGIRNCGDDVVVKRAMLGGIESLLGASREHGREISGVNRGVIREVLEDVLFGGEKEQSQRDLMLVVAGRCMARYLHIVEAGEVDEIVGKVLAKSHAYSSLLVTKSLVTLAPEFMVGLKRANEMIVAVDVSKPDVVACLGAKVLAEALLVEGLDGIDALGMMLEVLGNAGASGDVKKTVLLGVKTLAKTRHEEIVPRLGSVMNALMVCGRSNSMPVKIAAERAIFYTLRFGQDQNWVLKEYVKGLKEGDEKKMLEYSKRVLVKLEVADSDGE
jgi:hypothetical protein